MTTQYQRIATATIQNRENGETIEVAGLRFTFDIKKKQKTDENSANIGIYNMSPSSRRVCEATKDKLGGGQTHIELRVGYRGTTPTVIFRGLCDAINTYTAPNWVTSLRGLDGSSQYRKFFFEKTYPKGTLVQVIVDDLIRASGTTPVNSPLPITAVLSRGRAFSGPPKNIIENLQSKYGFEFDVQDEETKSGAGTKTAILAGIPQVILTRTSGLIGEPQVKGEIVKANCLLNPQIRPGAPLTLFSLEQPLLNGVYTVKKADMKGDSWSGDWSMSLELSRSGNGPTNYMDDLSGGVIA